MKSKKQVSGIIENMIKTNKNSLEIVSESLASNTSPAYLLNLIESKQLTPTGSGDFKTCYRKGNIAVLYETSYVTSSSTNVNEFLKEKKIVDILIQLGVQTPKFLDFVCFSDGRINKIISTQEFVEGTPIYTFDNYFSTTEEQTKTNNPLKKSNLAILKERVSLGEQFIEAYIDGFNILYPLRLLFDSHGKNIIFNKKTGYHFIDLGFSTAPIFSNLEEAKSLIQNPITTQPSRRIDNRAYLGPKASYKDQAKYIFCFSTLSPTSYSCIRNNFPYFVYNGILAQQFENCVSNKKNLPSKFFEGTPATKQPFTLNINDLKFLYFALKNQDQARLDMFKFTYGLPESYDFDKELDTKFFLDIMEKSFISKKTNENQAEM